MTTDHADAIREAEAKLTEALRNAEAQYDADVKAAEKRLEDARFIAQATTRQAEQDLAAKRAEAEKYKVPSTPVPAAPATDTPDTPATPPSPKDDDTATDKPAPADEPKTKSTKDEANPSMPIRVWNWLKG